MTDRISLSVVNVSVEDFSQLKTSNLSFIALSISQPTRPESHFKEIVEAFLFFDLDQVLTIYPQTRLLDRGQIWEHADAESHCMSASGQTAKLTALPRLGPLKLGTSVTGGKVKAWPDWRPSEMRDFAKSRLKRSAEGSAAATCRD
jgi:hypothetical protein